MLNSCSNAVLLVWGHHQKYVLNVHRTEKERRHVLWLMFLWYGWINLWTLQHCKTNLRNTASMHKKVNEMNPTIWSVLSMVWIFLSLTTVTVTLAWVFSLSFFSFESLEKLNKLFFGLGSFHVVKNFDLGLENAALGLWPQEVFLRPRLQIFHYTDLPASK